MNEELQYLTRWQRVRYRSEWVLHMVYEAKPGWWVLRTTPGVVLAILTFVVVPTDWESLLWFLGAVAFWEGFVRSSEWLRTRRRWKMAGKITEEVPDADFISVMQISDWLLHLPGHRYYLVEAWRKRLSEQGVLHGETDFYAPGTPREVRELHEQEPPVEGPWWSPGEN